VPVPVEPTSPPLVPVPALPTSLSSVPVPAEPTSPPVVSVPWAVPDAVPDAVPSVVVVPALCAWAANGVRSKVAATMAWMVFMQAPP
jgi:hypothetical protein